MPFRLLKKRESKKTSKHGDRKIISSQPQICSPNDRNNFISTRRYNWFTFFPYSLLFQFRKLSNCYFLAIAVLVQIPGVAPVNRFSLVIPLVFVLLISELREFLEEWSTSRRDKSGNEQSIELLSGEYKKSKDLKPGHIVKIYRNSQIPADVLILQTSNSDGSVFIETANLDGETNLRLKRAPGLTNSVPVTDLGIPSTIHVTCDHPSVDMYSFHGIITCTNKTERIHLTNVIWRGCTVRNTEWMIGLVLYSGNETRIILNARAMGIVPSKQTCIDKQMSRFVIGIFCLQIVLCILAASIGRHQGSGSWYLGNLNRSKWQSLFSTYLVLLASLIPVSLWVSLEILRVIQGWLIEKSPAIVSALNKPLPSSCGITCNSKNLHDELGNIGYVFTDKTGTLTSNEMKFIGAVTTIDDDDSRVEKFFIPNDKFDNDIIEPVIEFRGVVPPSQKLVNMLRDDTVGSNTRNLLTCLSLCHSCERITDPSTGEISNQSTSPDEAALVSVAAECGYIFMGRHDSNHIDISVDSVLKRYEILHAIPFTSERKMMTIVVREIADVSGDILIVSKGADSSILPKCSSPTFEIQRHVDMYSSMGYRTLCCAMRRISGQLWNEKFQIELDRLKTVGTGQKRFDDELESQFQLIGCTIVEDRLQDGVDVVLKSLRAAGIKVCMITGDKRETAINIATTCGLLSSRRNVYIMMGGSVTSPPLGGGIFVPLSHLDDISKKKWKPNDSLSREYWLNETREMGMDSSSVDGGVRGRAASEEEEFLDLGNVARKLSQSDGVLSPPTSLGSGTCLKFSLVIEGKHLKSILGSKTASRQLVDVLTFQQCEAVIFCRVTPKQKGDIVSLVTCCDSGISFRRLSDRKGTLAIGDGANDVNMIKLANIGVGISGSEGSQAANTADYAIAKFFDLYALIFIHGRLNYERTRKFILIFIYKNFSFALIQFWFGTVNMFSGQTGFDSTYLLLYNSVFGILPLMVLGIWDVDVPQSASNRLPRSDGELESGTRDNERRWFERIVPLLYKNEQKFSVINVFLWCTMGVVHSLIVFYSVWYGWSSSVMSSQGQLASLWLISLLAYSVEICIVSAMTLWVASTWTHLLLWTTLLFNIGAYFAFVFVYNNIDRHGNGEYVSYIAPLAMGNWQFWLLLALVVSMAVLPLVIGNRLVNLIPPLHFKERVMRIIRK